MKWILTKRMGMGILLVVLAAFVTGCPPGVKDQGVPSTVAQQPPPFSEKIKSGLDVIRVGDVLHIVFTDIPDQYPPMERRVREDGTITGLPMNQTIVAAGLKVGELEKKIRELYVPKYYKRMTVQVQVRQRMFTVGGYVRAPGRYPYMGEMTVLQAIRVAGDFNEFAKKTEVRVTRADGTVIIVNCKKALKDPRYDIPIYPGDDIYVPRSLW